MLAEQVKKRNRTFWWLFAGLLASPLVLIALSQLVEMLGLGFHFCSVLWCSYIIYLQYLYFKAMYHWAKAKGYHGAFCLLGVLGLFGILALAVLWDRLPEEPGPGDPLLNCPECDSQYRLSEYRPDAESIFCSRCNAALLKG